jgi:hypothetical protein
MSASVAGPWKLIRLLRTILFASETLDQLFETGNASLFGADTGLDGLWFLRASALWICMTGGDFRIEERRRF